MIGVVGIQVLAYLGFPLDGSQLIGFTLLAAQGNSFEHFQESCALRLRYAR
jgi:hypothetical protein